MSTPPRLGLDQALPGGHGAQLGLVGASPDTLRSYEQWVPGGLGTLAA